MWTPLESSPEGLNHYLNKLGVVNSSYQFVDVFGVQEELLDMIPRPVKAMLLVFPLSRAVEMHYRSLLDDQSETTEAFIQAHSVFFARQTIGNACGTVALLHALLNNLDALGELSPDCLLSKIHALMSQTPEDVGTDDPPGGLTAAEQANVNARGLEVLDELRDAHADAADFGEAIQEQDFATNLHFVCFVEIGGRCVEFDGRRPLPVLHGECTDNAHFVSEASKAIETIMSLDPQSFNFAITALARTQPEATA